MSGGIRGLYKSVVRTLTSGATAEPSLDVHGNLIVSPAYDSPETDLLDKIRIAVQSALSFKQAPTSSISPGVPLSLSVTTILQFAASPCPVNLAVVSAPLANTAACYVGFHQALTTSNGIELQPGDSVTLPVANLNQIYAITGTATQNLRALPL